ncbi:MAG TPA: MerR family transcriptional regulator [Novosphingobium sp.]|nr:MerR family transcriptional regulator [Novosphingobium sp.]
MSSQAPLDFADGKTPEAFRTIGEVAQAFGVKQHVLRYWEEQFPMLRPLKRAGGRRYYRAEDVRLIAEINRLLYREGFTIRGARQALGGKGGAGGSAVPIASGLAPERHGEELARPAALSRDLDARLMEVRNALSEALQHD